MAACRGKEGRPLHLVEAEAVVRSLSVAMHGDQQFVIPLLRLEEFDQYTTTHALNVSILAMSLADFIGLAPGEVRAFVKMIRTTGERVKEIERPDEAIRGEAPSPQDSPG